MIDCYEFGVRDGLEGRPNIVTHWKTKDEQSVYTIGYSVGHGQLIGILKTLNVNGVLNDVLVEAGIHLGNKS